MSVASEQEYFGLRLSGTYHVPHKPLCYKIFPYNKYFRQQPGKHRSSFLTAHSCLNFSDVDAQKKYFDISARMPSHTHACINLRVQCTKNIHWPKVYRSILFLLRKNTFLAALIHLQIQHRFRHISKPCLSLLPFRILCIRNKYILKNANWRRCMRFDFQLRI